jgi:predicted phage tail protein
MREIRVYGALAKFLGQRSFFADISSVAEAVKFLLANFPQLEAHMIEQNYRVKAGRRFVTEDDIHSPVGREIITIAPVIAGAGGAVRILTGIALIAVASLVTFGTLGGLLGAGVLNSAIFGIGASLALGGVASLLTPVPKISGPGINAGSVKSDSDASDPRKNYNFSGVQNTSRQGAPVPIVYGECLVGSIVVSAGIDIAQVSA